MRPLFEATEATELNRHQLRTQIATPGLGYSIEPRIEITRRLIQELRRDQEKRFTRFIGSNPQANVPKILLLLRYAPLSSQTIFLYSRVGREDGSEHGRSTRCRGKSTWEKIRSVELELDGGIVHRNRSRRQPGAHAGVNPHPS